MSTQKLLAVALVLGCSGAGVHAQGPDAPDVVAVVDTECGFPSAQHAAVSPALPDRELNELFELHTQATQAQGRTLLPRALKR